MNHPTTTRTAQSTALPTRPATVLTLGTLLILAVTLLLPNHVQAAPAPSQPGQHTAAASPTTARTGSYSNAAIADVALRYVGRYGGAACVDAGRSGYTGGPPLGSGNNNDGECRAFLNCVVKIASGGTQWLGGGGGDYFNRFEAVGGTRITDSAALVKGDIVQNGRYDSSRGLHTFIIVGRVSGATYDVVDSNSRYDHVVRPSRRTVALSDTTRAYRLGTVTSSNTSSNAFVIAKTGTVLYGKAGLSDTWVRLGDTDGQIKTAGTRIAFLNQSGQLWAKDGLYGTWLHLLDSVTSFDMSAQYVVAKIGTAVFGKAGLSDTWVRLTDTDGPVRVEGTRIAFRDSSGNLWAKDGLYGTWLHLLDGVTSYDMSAQYVVAKTGTVLYGKAGLSDTWVRLGDTNGPVRVEGTWIAFLNADGSLWAKEGLYGTWLHLLDSVTSFDMSTQYVVAKIGTAVFGKAGLSGTWVRLTDTDGPVRVEGTRIAFRDSSGNLWAKDGLYGTWLHLLDGVTSYDF